ncbi:MAG: hypothetical protein LR005_00265, partial [Candidatus Pacebacteria bacterium]|nr:hypothetical protein [Candidatus Paceibacterota bacterium]
MNGNKYIKEVDEKINQMNEMLSHIQDRMSEAVYMGSSPDFMIDMYFKLFKIDHTDIKIGSFFLITFCQCCERYLFFKN